MALSTWLTDEQIRELLYRYYEGAYHEDVWPARLRALVGQARQEVFNLEALTTLSDENLVEPLVSIYREVVRVPMYYKAITGDPGRIRAALLYLLQADDDLVTKVDALMSSKGAHNVKGLGKTFWSLFLMALEPEQNPYWTGKTNDALRALGMASWTRSDSPGQVYSRIAEAENALVALHPQADLPTVDHFMHYVVELEGRDMLEQWRGAAPEPGRVAEGNPPYGESGEAGYWKIAPGLDAWNWEACRDGGFIAIGWDDLGDISGLSRSEFETLRDELVAKHEDWHKVGVDQVWRFAHLQEGDRIVANHGTTRVLGIGTVAGPYYFVPDVRHGHRLPVPWDDLTLRRVQQPGWRRTLIKLTREKFIEVSGAPAIESASTLAEPFSGIFASRDEARWALDLLGESLERLGVEDPGDPRFAVTLRDSGTVLRLNFGNWAVLQFYGPTRSEYRVGIALIDEQVPLESGFGTWNPFADVQPSVTVYDLPIEAVRPLEGDLRTAFENTFSLIADRFRTWKASNYRPYNQSQIAEAIFDDAMREELLGKGLSQEVPPEPSFWWVNQGTTQSAEIEGGYLWAPLWSRSGQAVYHWDMLEELSRGDVVLHYSDGYLRHASQVLVPCAAGAKPHSLGGGSWDEEGRLVRVVCQPVEPPIPVDRFARSLMRLQIPQGPVTGIGGVKQGYLFRLTPEALALILASQPDASWPEFVVNLLLPKPGFPVAPPYPLAQFAEDTGLSEERLASWRNAVNRKGQAVLYGPPGTGKTYVAERLARHLVGGSDGFWELVQFHPAYAYEDFIQGIRPRPLEGGGLEYPLVRGRFLRFCDEAEKRTGACALIIDEINRANLARVFGELMYLLEYRDREIPLAAGGVLRIPRNVRIIGTMNTADRSIALVDHALRRRFAFLALYPNYDVLRQYHDRTGFVVNGLVQVLQRLNHHIGDQHYEVGITFFLREDLAEQIGDIWQMEIEPYLEEYFFDQPGKVDQFRWPKIQETVLP